MISKKIRVLLSEFRERDNSQKVLNEYIKAQTIEIEWAHIYHDTIRGREWLEKIAISPGRWAGNYSFFYILVRILADYKPRKIIEFGLGETSKIVSAFIQNEMHESSHLIIEQSYDWIESFKSRYTLFDKSTILNLPLEVTDIKGFPVNSYKGLADRVKEAFNLYIVDGPFGSDHFSRFDICVLTEHITPNDQFIIIIDDYNRLGEKETVEYLTKQLNKKGIKIYTGEYLGNKSQFIIASELYQFTVTM